MKTWLDFESKKWVSKKPKKYWTGLICENTNEKIFTGDTISIEYLDFRSHRLKTKIQRKLITLDIYFYCGHNKFQQMWKPILISHNENQ